MSRRILFFGRKDCEYTQKALSHLRLLNFDVEVVAMKSRAEKLPEGMDMWDGDFILCFRSYYILPEHLIKRAKVAAINFHPGPPEHPGTGCINFALYNGDKEYGCTAHLINKEIDSGKIIKTKTFPIAPNDNVNSLLKRTHHEMLSMFYEVVDALNKSDESNVDEIFKENSPPKKWSRKARTLKDLDSLQVSDVNIDEKELLRRIRATHTKDFPTSIVFHGYRFELRSKE